MSLLPADRLYKVSVHPVVVSQFRMEGRSQSVSLPGSHNVAIDS